MGSRRFTAADVAAAEARRLARQGGAASIAEDSAAAHREARLHADILNECRRRGWLPFHGSMAHATFRTPGEPDFIILAHGGRPLLVEAKAAKGKLSPAQRAVAAWAMRLGFQVHVVHSLAAFISLADEASASCQQTQPQPTKPRNEDQR
jgi:hypothetical protein